MSTGEYLAYLMRYHDDSFKGVYARNQLPLNEKKNHCLIVNSDVSSLKGTHWLAIHVCNNSVYIFDPLGWLVNRHICSAYQSFNIFYNDVQFQNINSSYCGEHCVYFLYNNIGADNDSVALEFINKYLV